MNANWNERWTAQWSAHKKNALLRGIVSLSGAFAIPVSVSMILDGFFRRWDVARHDFVGDPWQGVLGIAVLISGLFAVKYAGLVADALHPLPRLPTVREAAVSRPEQVRAQPKSRILLPGDPDFRI